MIRSVASPCSIGGIGRSQCTVRSLPPSVPLAPVSRISEPSVFAAKRSATCPSCATPAVTFSTTQVRASPAAALGHSAARSSNASRSRVSDAVPVIPSGASRAVPCAPSRVGAWSGRGRNSRLAFSTVTSPGAQAASIRAPRMGTAALPLRSVPAPAFRSSRAVNGRMPSAVTSASVVTGAVRIAAASLAAGQTAAIAVEGSAPIETRSTAFPDTGAVARSVAWVAAPPTVSARSALTSVSPSDRSSSPSRRRTSQPWRPAGAIRAPLTTTRRSPLNRPLSSPDWPKLLHAAPGSTTMLASRIATVRGRTLPRNNAPSSSTTCTRGASTEASSAGMRSATSPSLTSIGEPSPPWNPSQASAAPPTRNPLTCAWMRAASQGISIGRSASHQASTVKPTPPTTRHPSANASSRRSTAHAVRAA